MKSLSVSPKALLHHLVLVFLLSTPVVENNTPTTIGSTICKDYLLDFLQIVLLTVRQLQQHLLALLSVYMPQKLLVLRFQTALLNSLNPPISGCLINLTKTRLSLRSTSITAVSSLLQITPLLNPTSVL